MKSVLSSVNSKSILLEGGQHSGHASSILLGHEKT